MKKVFSSSTDVIHLFAQRTQSEGRSSNIFFEGTNKIYSYGHHYLLGEFIFNHNNELAIMINNKGYSSTTSKHIHGLYSATSQYKQFSLMNCDSVLVLNQLESLIEKLKNARKPEIYINNAHSLINAFTEYLTWKNDKLSNYPQINSAFAVFQTKEIKKYYEQKAEALKLAEAKREKELKKKSKEQLKNFFDYKNRTVYGLTEDFCRISLDKLFVETTQGVKIPIQSAKILYTLIKAKKDIKGFSLEGEYSTYTVIGLNGVLKIGCHKINVKNMHEIGAKLLNL